MTAVAPVPVAVPLAPPNIDPKGHVLGVWDAGEEPTDSAHQRSLAHPGEGVR